MKIMLDCSPEKIYEYSDKYSHDFWQLRTPLTRYKLSGKPYALDNGCFSGFERSAWMSLLREARDARPQFVTLPDIVGDARRTLELFEHFKTLTEGLPRALVLQDGIGDFSIPWDEIDALFVGGGDRFKCSPECHNAVRAGRILGKWIHVGRVNTTSRAKGWLSEADSIDGSGISRFDQNLHEVLAVVTSGQETLFN